MCGIAGIYNPTENVSPELVAAMNQSISHRGPDDGGEWVRRGIGLANRRLSILDLSVAGHQPMGFPERGLWIAYNGEVYNFHELRAELEQKDYTFFSHSDTEVVLKAYDAWGNAAFRRLRGMFALALWDEKNQELILVRDPFGIKPLYYAQCGGDFVFGSELKALRVHPQFPTAIDPNSLAFYFSHLYIPEPCSIYANVSRLPAGHLLLVNAHGIKQTCYSEPTAPSLHKGAYQDIAAELIQVLQDSVQAHLVADVPVGVFLSGGVDSSVVVALMRRMGQKEIKTFTIGYDPKFGSYDERPYARRVADLFQTDHHEIVVTPDLERLVRNDLLEMFDEPFGNPAALIASAISEFARQHVKVALAGVGGDELFGGYPRYAGMMWLDRWARVPAPMQSALAFGLEQLPHSPDRRSVIGRARRLISAAQETSSKRYENMTTFIPSELTKTLLTSEYANALDSRAYLPGLDASRASVLDSVMDLDMATYLPGDLLNYTDRASMWHSLEVRVPFCDTKVVNFARRVPARYKLNGHELKFILKDAFSTMIPHEVLFRTKRGFSLPLGEWLVGPLRPLVREFADASQRTPNPCLNAQVVTQVVSSFESGNHDYAYLLWAILLFDLWFKKFHS